jgi:hypothetical protein
MNQTTNKRDFFILMVVFLLAVCVRIPNLDRPLSKHHEFNSAVVLNNIVSWQEAGGASVYNFVPVMTYPGAENRLIKPAINTDDLGNQVYLSLGPGFFVLPYLVFDLLHIAPSPLALQIFNIGIHLLLLLALYYLCTLLSNRLGLNSQFALYCCIAFLFMPGPLWYFGNGYVHTAVALPFAIMAFAVFLKNVCFYKKLTPSSIAGFCSMSILSIYIDWYAFFLLATLSAYSFFMFLKTRAVWWIKVGFLNIITAIVGVGLVFIQFASSVGWTKVLDYWRARFTSRSFDMENESVFSHIISLGINLASCIGLAAILSTITLLIWLKKRNDSTFGPKEQRLILLWGIACIVYNGLFFNWTYIHEFSLLPLSVVLSILTALFILKTISVKYRPISLFLLTAINITQYCVINPSGEIARVGTPYNTKMLMGNAIGKEAPKGFRIFSTVADDPVIQYYAHRSIHFAENPTEAMKLCDSFKIPKAVWVECDSVEMKKVTILKQ